MEMAAEHAASSATSSPSSIIDRKRELKAIPGSFSYNLGRRVSGLPPRLDLSPSHSPSRSVRSIVAWIESSATSAKRSSRPPASDEDGIMRPRASSYRLHGSSPPRLRELGTTGVDSDCPTFLDYRRYFARGSLARCLDEQQPPETTAPSTCTEEEGEMVAGKAAPCGNQRRGTENSGMMAGGECVAAEKRSPAEVAAL